MKQDKGNVITAGLVVKRYGKLTAVDNVNLQVPAGSIYGLIGANGAGKSTLIRMLVGIAAPDSGRVEICGEVLDDKHPKVKRHLGYLPEELTFYDRLTGTEYLKFVAGLKESDPGQIEPELAFFELNAVAGKLVGSYSLGMRKKLGLAAAFLGNPEALILDEPLNGLDVEMSRKLRLRLESERSSGCGVLVADHDLGFIERLCDRVGVLRAGKLLVEGPPVDLRQQTGLQSGPFEDVFFEVIK